MWKSEEYEESRKNWPMRGKIILAQHDCERDAVCVYQAFNDKIADFAVENQRFIGAPGYGTERMTWIKTNFLWMMFRCGWASKHNQNRVLAIWLKKDSFVKYLENAHTHGGKDRNGINVRLQWDPDHYPNGNPHPSRKAVQLGLKHVTSFHDGGDIVAIEDITPFVIQQRQFLRPKSNTNHSNNNNNHDNNNTDNNGNNGNSDGDNGNALRVARERVFDEISQQAHQCLFGDDSDSS